MGRRCSPQEHLDAVAWAQGRNLYAGPHVRASNLAELRESYDRDLKEYFRLGSAARGRTTDPQTREMAHKTLFAARVRVERALAQTVEANAHWMEIVFDGSFFGCSKKQGTSLRMPLSSCKPTVLCAGGCYAHDALDAVPNSIIRGALNGVVARRFEAGTEREGFEIANRLRPHVKRAIRNAVKEVEALESGSWTRRPYIRFSHVGEIVAFPKFANTLARMVWDASDGHVDCVVYTRLKSVNELDPDLWTINFTLDQSSRDRKAWVPPHARIVFSAFGGEVDPDAEVNFLEHHRWAHLSPIGKGRVCPATAPDVAERTCDAVRCNRCFVRPRS
jgi:hypothetical protein